MVYNEQYIKNVFLLNITHNRAKEKKEKERNKNTSVYVVMMCIY